ncbi:MAG: hypothetical protein M3P24_04365, partial [Gemmatimonadota bacterium]|nr:hypothetical protein [Gemmatimonadota bacterium]
MESERQDRSSEDTTENREHVSNTAENRDALAEQARRVDATAPASTDTPIEGTGGQASEDTS